MMDSIRRTLLATGAAAAATAAAPRAFAQQNTGQGGTTMPFYEKGNVRIRYEDQGGNVFSAFNHPRRRFERDHRLLE